MKKYIPVVGALALAASRVSAQIVYEPFDYGSDSIGKNLSHTSTGTPDPFSGYTNPMSGSTWFDTLTNNTSTNTPFEISIIGGNLSGPATSGLQAATGNKVEFNVANAVTRTSRIGFSPTGVTSGTMYYSLAFKVTDKTNLTVGGAGAFFASFNDAQGTSSANPSNDQARLQLRIDPNDPTSSRVQVGIKSGTNTNTIGVTYDFDNSQNFATGPSGDTIFVVVAHTINAGTGNDESKLWVNPSATTFGAGTAPTLQPVGVAGTLDVASGSDYNSSGYSSLILRQGNTLIPKGIQVDEVRIDSTWGGVTAPTGVTWNGGTTNYNTGTNWSGGTVPTGLDVNSNPQYVNFNSAGAGNVSVSSPITVGTINLKSTTAYNISGSQITLDGNGAAGQGNFNVYATVDPTTGAVQTSNHTVANNIVMATNVGANVATSQTLSLTGVLSGSGKTLNKNGAGVLVLGNGSNSFDGGVLIREGTVAITSDGNLGGAAGPVTMIGGTLRFDASTSLPATRGITINGAVINNTGGSYNVAGIGTLNVPTGISATVTGVITGVGAGGTSAMTKSGSGTLVLTNANTYTGNFIQGGSLAVSADNQLGNVPASPNTNITFTNAASVKLLSAFDINSNRVINLGSSGGGGIDTNGFDSNFGGRIFGAGRFQKRGAGTLTLNYAGTDSNYQGVTQILGGTLRVGASNLIGNDTVANSVQLEGGTLKTTASFASVNRGLILQGTGGTIDTNGNNLTFGGAVTGAGALTKSSLGELKVNAITSAGNVTINAGKVTVAARTANVNKPIYIDSLAMDPSATFDTNDNDLIVANGTFAALQSLVFQGYRGGPDTTATGIVSSTSQNVAGGTTILALFDNSLAGFGEWPQGSGHTITTPSIVGKYTYIGDTNMDGQVTPQDYTATDANLNTSVDPAISWFYGDTNFDGNIDASDYTGIDAALNLGVGNPLAAQGLAAVPEPTSLSLLGLGAVGLLARRRRKA